MLVALWDVAMWPVGLWDGCNFNGYSGIQVWILIFRIRFKNIRGYQVLSVSVSMGTDSYPKPCPTDFLSAGTRINDIHCHPYPKYQTFPINGAFGSLHFKGIGIHSIK